MSGKNQMVLALFCFYLSVYTAFALECYVCKDQETNYDKCIKTVRTCESFQDTCLTVVKWGATPYWEAGDKKQYYITKECTTKELCHDTRSKLMPRCDRVWYNEWECGECCPGDRCNYYAVLGASSIQGNKLVLLTALAVVLLFCGLRR